MKEANDVPDTITYSALIGACEKGMQWGEAFKVMIAWLGPL
jgi:hypothetical protein